MVTYTATYSPDDNKLRLYASSRLDAETFARVKAAGFKWAPKQELFVAPMWTPSREDLLIELAGEIEDEDKSLVDRAEERAERFEDYSEKRAADAESARNGVAAIADNIPFGQPILVGHHSERHARKDAERIQNGMRKAVQMWKTSKYWTSRAAGAIAAAKYKELPDVRHRRIKGIESDKRKLEKTHKYCVDRLALWQATESMSPEELHVRALQLTNTESGGGHVKLADGTDHWSAWSALSDGKITAEEIQRQRVESYPPAIERQERWIEHYDNRLAYERAMLAEQLGQDDANAGGMAARFDLQVGGKVLVGRDEWLTIIRVNKAQGVVNSVTTTAPASVTWTRSWQYGIEKIKDYKPPTEEQAAKVKAALKLPPICNYPGEGFLQMTEAEWKARRQWSDFPYIGHHARTETVGAHRFRQMPKPGAAWQKQQVFITDGKRIDPPAPSARPKLPAPERDPSATPIIRQPRAEDPNAAEFAALEQSLKAGVQVVTAPTLFPTPPELAARMVDLGDIRPGHRVLEPSAGTGNLIRPLPDGCSVIAVEVSPMLARDLPRHVRGTERIHSRDFLECGALELGSFDRVIMNPPFDGGADIKHIKHALGLLRPRGRLVAICANGPRQQDQLKPLADTWEELPAGTFDGTGVRAALVVIDKEPQPLPTELTPIGEQFVIPGCEKDRKRGPAQFNLWDAPQQQGGKP